MTLDKRFARILKELDKISNDLEERGLKDHSNALDAAAGKIEDVKSTFERL